MGLAKGQINSFQFEREIVAAAEKFAEERVKKAVEDKDAKIAELEKVWFTLNEEKEKAIREAVEATTIECQKDANAVHEEIVKEAEARVWEEAAKIADETAIYVGTAKTQRDVIASALRSRGKETK